MEDVKTYEERKTMVMEGMYKGMTGKLEEVRQSVSKELQFSSAQNASAYESLAGAFKQGMESLLAEFRYLSQQNSAIYDYNQKERTSAKDALLEAVRACTEQIAALEARMNEKIDAVKAELAEKVAEEISALHVAAPAEAPAEEKAEPAAEEPAAEPVTDENFDYDVLAEKIASVMPEVDYDLLVDKVVAAIPPTDADAVAAAVVATIPQVDENAIADRVAESVPLVDYDLVAERVASVMENEFDVTVDENGIEKIASAVAAEIDYEKLAARVAELLKEQGAFAVVAAPAAEEPVPEEPAEEPEEPAPAEAAPAEEPAPAEPEAPAEEELAMSAAPAAEPKPAYTPVVVPVPDDPSLMTRFKRSFKAKIIESTEEIKNYYFDLKNAFLSYARVSSQVSWSNDRFTYAGDTIAKIGVRGKTLCLYVALNPDEFPSSVYHQKFAGDTKMYEKTPMMIKIKSGVAVKRGIRLIEMLMENLGAVREENFAPVDYADEFAFRSEEQLLAEGLIKTAIVEKSDLDF